MSLTAASYIPRQSTSLTYPVNSMSSDKGPTHCRCGAATEEDWEFCSRQCGVAAALLKLTAGDELEGKVEGEEQEDTSPTLPFSALGEELDSDHERLAVSAFLKMLRDMEPSFSRVAADRKEQMPGSANYLSSDGSLSQKEGLTFDHRLGRDFDTTERSLPTGANCRNSSLDTRKSRRSSHNDTSGSRIAYSPTTSIPQIDFHTPLPRNNKQSEITAPLSIGQKFRRSRRRDRTMPQLKVHWYKDHSRFAPKETPSVLPPRTPFTSPTMFRNEVSRGEFIDRRTAVGLEKWNGITLPRGFEEEPRGNPFQEHSGGGSFSRSDSLKARVRRKSRSDQTSLRNLQAPCTGMKRKIPVPFAHCRSPTAGPSTSYTRTRLSSALKKFSDRVFSKVKRQSPKPPDVVFEIVSGSADAPSLFTETSSYGPIHVLPAASPSAMTPGMKSLLRSTSPDVPTSPTATRSSVAMSAAFPLTPYADSETGFMLTRRQVVSSSEHNEIANLALHATSRTVPFDHALVESIDGGPFLGPGQPVYLQLDNQEGTLVGPRHDDSEDDVWHDFVTFQCARERSTSGHTIWE